MQFTFVMYAKNHSTWSPNQTFPPLTYFPSVIYAIGLGVLTPVRWSCMPIQTLPKIGWLSPLPSYNSLYCAKKRKTNSIIRFLIELRLLDLICPGPFISVNRNILEASWKISLLDNRSLVIFSCVRIATDIWCDIGWSHPSSIFKFAQQQLSFAVKANS